MSLTVPVAVTLPLIGVELPKVVPAQLPGEEGAPWVRLRALPPLAFSPEAVPVAASA